ncbi:MAG: hypothetical protein IPI06_02875 [Gammaproteobacteria bacterium]|jgi:hypothetical protein|nr:hypothetical protein [Gammaproteobacteria bacterium]
MAMFDLQTPAALDAQRAGFDLSLIRESLRCTHEQRALQHQAALHLALELEAIGRHLRDGTESTAATAQRR